uniref:Fibrinogen C-terminal domain-containing protein n=1 Tax=Anopheles minimus TaxID=112268 RepID=A0A182W260_9DIPT
MAIWCVVFLTVIIGVMANNVTLEDVTTTAESRMLEQIERLSQTLSDIKGINDRVDEMKRDLNNISLILSEMNKSSKDKPMEHTNLGCEYISSCMGESLAQMQNETNAMFDTTNRVLGTISDSLQNFSTSNAQRMSNHEQMIERVPQETGYLQLDTCNNIKFEVSRDWSDNHGYGDNWIVFQRRFNGSVIFYRNWTEYKQGFGDLHGEHWLGLDKLHTIVKTRQHELLIELKDFRGVIAYAHYDDFKIGDESEKYVIKSVGRYTGTAGDSFSAHKDEVFSTYDQDNDRYSESCATRFLGAWWFNKCFNSHLNGKYLRDKTVINLETINNQAGICWERFRGLLYSLKSTKMMYKQGFGDLHGKRCTKLYAIVKRLRGNPPLSLEDVTSTAESRILYQVERLARILSDKINLFNDRVDDMQKVTNRMFDSTNTVLEKLSQNLQSHSTSTTQQLFNLERKLERIPHDTGVYAMQPDSTSNATIEVSRDWTNNHGFGDNWIVFQRRSNGSVNFYRNWTEYKLGFGDLHGEHWLGLDKLHAIVKTRYDDFKIGNESEKYVLKSIGRYSGTAGDSFAYHKGCSFTTYDQDNDNANTNCAHSYGDKLENFSTWTTQQMINLEYKLGRLSEDTGVFLMHSNNTNDLKFEVSRDWGSHEFGSSWIVFQRRFNGSVDFYRNWTEYKQGFGDLHGEHWLGLDKLHAIVKTRQHELLIVLEDFGGVIAYAHYDDFKIGNESEKYVIKSVGRYTGTAGDSFSAHKDKVFSTYDQDNDRYTESCATRYLGAWWFDKCFNSHLNGMYLTDRRTINLESEINKQAKESCKTTTESQILKQVQDSLRNLSDKLENFSTWTTQQMINLEYKLGRLSEDTGVFLMHSNNTNDLKFEVSRDWGSHEFGRSWIVFQRRFNGSLGFGDLHGEHWLGLDKLHAIVKTRQHELLIVLEDFGGVIAYAHYDDFKIGNESEKYVLKSIGHYSGTAGDSFVYHKGCSFSTYDQDNDESTHHCAKSTSGAWWFNMCHLRYYEVEILHHLNGAYLKGKTEINHDSLAITEGIYWKGFRGLLYSLKSTKMMVRPVMKNEILN